MYYGRNAIRREVSFVRRNFQSAVPDMHETLSNFPEQFGDGPRKPEIKAEMPKESDRTTDNLKCGWFWFRPIYLQKFRTAKWALFWLCWAGAMQGWYILIRSYQ